MMFFYHQMKKAFIIIHLLQLRLLSMILIQELFNRILQQKEELDRDWQIVLILKKLSFFL